MEKRIYDQLDEEWTKVIIDGTKSPVKETLRKQLRRLTNVPNYATTITESKPLVVIFYFNEGGKKEKIKFFYSFFFI